MSDDTTETTETTPTPTPDPFPGLKHGRHVDYIFSNGQHRVAIVARRFDRTSDMVQLQVLTDGQNDHDIVSERDAQGRVPAWVWRTSVHYAPAGENTPNTWHWPQEDD